MWCVLQQIGGDQSNGCERLRDVLAASGRQRGGMRRFARSWRNETLECPEHFNVERERVDRFQPSPGPSPPRPWPPCGFHKGSSAPFFAHRPRDNRLCELSAWQYWPGLSCTCPPPGTPHAHRAIPHDLPVTKQAESGESIRPETDQVKGSPQASIRKRREEATWTSRAS